MTARYVHVESIQQAREFLELGLLYENITMSTITPIYRLCDRYSSSQLDQLEDGEPCNWPLSDYVYVLED